MSNNSLVGTENAGYKIVRQGKEAVIGEKVSEIGGITQVVYVAWSYHFEAGKPSFYWGRYAQDLGYAEECFHKKERGEYSGS